MNVAYAKKLLATLETPMVRVSKADMLRAVECGWRLFDEHGGMELEQRDDVDVVKKLYLACDAVMMAHHQRCECAKADLEAVWVAAVEAGVRGAALQMSLGLGEVEA